LTELFPLTAIPTDTVKAVKEAGLVESIQYRPSRERELLSRAEPLTMKNRMGAESQRRPEAVARTGVQGSTQGSSGA